MIIETSKGIEFGECALANTMVDEMELIVQEIQTEHR